MRIVPPALYNMGELDNMRLSLAAATCVVSVAFLAGCSTSSQGIGTLPGSSSVGQPMGHSMLHYMPKGGINPKDVLRLQAAGKIGYLGTRAGVEKALRQVQSQPLRLHPKGGGVGIWASLTYYDYILGINKKGKAVTKAIQTSGCTEPEGVKVDHSQNIWVGCYEGDYDTPTAQEYSSNGTLTGSYNAACPSNWQSSTSTDCEDYFYGYEGYDAAADSSHVFQDGYFYGYDCSSGPSCTYTYGSGVEWWPAGEPSATPTLIMLTYGSPVYDLDYMDEDTSGNLWLGFYGCTTSTCGYGLGEITSPTTSPTFNVIENPGTYEANGGVYVSNGGNTLNVLDPETRLTYQYSLPLSPGGSPSNKLGPNAPFGYPEGIGFNSTDKNVILGDEYAWLNLGTVASNKWKQTKPILLISDVLGTAYTPSDK
jgi:hypothetical protein